MVAYHDCTLPTRLRLLAGRNGDESMYTTEN